LTDPPGETVLYKLAQEAAMAVQRPVDGDGYPLRVLVVEDNGDGREMLRLLLELLGHEVIVAADGMEGVDKALAWHPHVAVVDIGLPRLNGYEVASRLRRELGCGIFLITQTGYGRPEDRQRAIAAGFDVHLTKPVDPAELISWLEAARRRLAASVQAGPNANLNNVNARAR
jgi:CheY-like chemotaxis protein